MPKKNGQPYRYEVVTGVVLDTSLADANPETMAAEVLRRDPKGTYEPYRICVDIERIIASSYQYTDSHINVTKKDRRHAESLRDRMMESGAWKTSPDT